MYKITDQFTSRDGEWFPSNKEYSITKEMAEKYGTPDFDDKGGATHLFAKIVGGPSKFVRFFTRDNSQNIPPVEIKPSGWANLYIEHGSGYRPDKGEEGWWNVAVSGAPSEIAKGLGLPYSWHVSSFRVFEWQDEQIPEDPTPVEPPANAEKIWVTADMGSATYAGFLHRIGASVND